MEYQSSIKALLSAISSNLDQTKKKRGYVRMDLGWARYLVRMSLVYVSMEFATLLFVPLASISNLKQLN